MEESDVTVLQIWDLPLDLLERILTVSFAVSLASKTVALRFIQRLVDFY